MMVVYVFVVVSAQQHIAVFQMDPATGKLTLREHVPTDLGLSVLCTDPRQRFLYAGFRQEAESSIGTFQIDPATGGLTPIGRVELAADPCYLATDKTGRYLLSAYYSAGLVAVSPIGPDGVAGGPPVEWRETTRCAHYAQTDRSNRFAFVPHVQQANCIFQYHFDQETGRLTPNQVAKVAGGPGQGPRHLAFHPSLDIVYADNEQESSVTAYQLDSRLGTLRPVQTVSTLPPDFEGENSNAQVRIHPSGRFLYASNRGHDSIACFALDPTTGALSSLGQQPSEGVPRAFNLDRQGRFLFAAGQATGRLTSYRIEPDGTLAPLEVYEVGTPQWVIALQYG